MLRRVFRTPASDALHNNDRNTPCRAFVACTRANATAGAAIVLGVLCAAAVVSVSQVGQKVSASFVQTSDQLVTASSRASSANQTQSAPDKTESPDKRRPPIVEVAVLAGVAAAAWRFRMG